MIQRRENPLFSRTEKKRARRRIRHKIKGAARSGLSRIFGIQLSPGLGGKSSRSTTHRSSRTSASSGGSSVRGDVISALKNLGYSKATAESMTPAGKSGEGFDALFRRAVAKNPGELVIFGNPAKVYGREQIRKANPQRMRNLIPAAVLEGLGFSLGETAGRKVLSKRKNAEDQLLEDIRRRRREEIPAVRRALKAAGYRARVKHGRGTASSWIVIDIEGRTFNESDYRRVLDLAANAAQRVGHSRTDNISVDFALRPNPVLRKVTFYNATKDLTVKINGDEFVIIGDDRKVTDKEILAMHQGKTPPGWKRTDLAVVNPRRNPSGEDQAADLFRTFHQREPQGATTLELQRGNKRRKDYTILGPLVAIGINAQKTDQIKRAAGRQWENYKVEHWDKLPHLCFMTESQVTFVKKVLDEPDQYVDGAPLLASSPNGKQLYIISTDPPEIDLRQFDVDASKDFVPLGDATFVVYVAKKPDQPYEWVHELGEDGGVRPGLMFDRIRKELFLIGGSYKVEAPGILN